MLKLSHVKKTFNKGTVTEKRALTDVDLTLNDGDFVTVIGGNGAGKQCSGKNRKKDLKRKWYGWNGNCDKCTDCSQCRKKCH